ncbi:MAG: class I SAM-dependent methyltransferase [Dokdonella sp.]
MTKRYDRAYFQRWYRDSHHRVGSRAELGRKVAMVVHLTEYYLARPLRNVLDIGCGEAPWRAPLKRLRPGIEYRGLDSSEYAIARYGRSRNIGRATFGQLGQLRFDRRYDLIVCSDVLHYVPAPELHRGLAGFGDLLEGLAFLETFTSRDDVSGDHAGFIARSPAWYRTAFAKAGLLACGSHAYLSPRLMRSVAALECLP